MNRWKHPVTLTIAVYALLVFFALVITFVYGAVDRMGSWEGADGTSWMWTDFPHIISGAIWSVLFCSGVVGLLVNLSDFIRCGYFTSSRFDLIKGMTHEENKEIGTWMTQYYYDARYLKNIWGE